MTSTRVLVFIVNLSKVAVFFINTSKNLFMINGFKAMAFVLTGYFLFWSHIFYPLTVGAEDYCCDRPYSMTHTLAPVSDVLHSHYAITLHIFQLAVNFDG